MFNCQRCHFGVTGAMDRENVGLCSGCLSHVTGAGLLREFAQAFAIPRGMTVCPRCSLPEDGLYPSIASKGVCRRCDASVPPSPTADKAPAPAPPTTTTVWAADLPPAVAAVAAVASYGYQIRPGAVPGTCVVEHPAAAADVLAEFDAGPGAPQRFFVAFSLRDSGGFLGGLPVASPTARRAVITAFRRWAAAHPDTVDNDDSLKTLRACAADEFFETIENGDGLDLMVYDLAADQMVFVHDSDQVEHGEHHTGLLESVTRR